MKNFQKLCLAGVFTLAFTTATFAGEIDTGGKTPPPPPPASVSATSSGETAMEPNADDSNEYQLLNDIIPDLLQIMLSVF